MPQFDRQGPPQGTGPMTGRKMGYGGAVNMEACIAHFKGEAGVTDAPRMCEWMRDKKKGVFADGEADVPGAVDEWKKLESKRPMFSGEEATSSAAHGALMRPEESAKGVRAFRPLVEAVTIDRVKRQIRCDVISEGLGNRRDVHYYGPVSIQDTARLLNGTRSFVNHAKESDEEERPEGDLWQQCGYWRDAIAESRDGKMTCVATLCLDKGVAGDEVLAKAEHALQMAAEFPELREHYAGISINGDGETEPRKMTVAGEEVNANFVSHVTAIASADVVTRAGRGGKFLALVESVRNAKGQGGSTIMNEAFKKELARFTEAMKTLSEDEKSTAQGLFDMLRESMDNVRTLAKADGTAIKEAEDEKPKEGEEEEEAEDEDKPKDESDDEKPKDEADDDDEEEAEDGEKKPPKESAQVRNLKRKLAKSEKKREAAESAGRKAGASEDIRIIKEAGLGDGMSDQDLAELPNAQRKMLVGIANKLGESGGLGISTTQRGSGGGNGKANLSGSFMNTLRAGAR